jgi:hypothetical protein
MQAHPEFQKEKSLLHLHRKSIPFLWFPRSVSSAIPAQGSSPCGGNPGGSE